MCNCDNPYIPSPAKIIDIIKHTDIEWTFRVNADTSKTKPGQFYEISLPKFGESPISVSGIGENFIDFTIRSVGRVTNEIFEYKIGDKLFIRGPYGNGFDLNEYIGKDLVIVVGGSALAPVRGIIQFVYNNPEKVKSFKLIAGFKSPKDVLFAKDLEEWGKKLDITLTVDGAEEGYKGNIGLVTKYIPELKFNDLSNVSAVVVGPPMMMKFSVTEFLKLNVAEKNIWVSYERNMHCGIGKCGHCKMDATYICLDGPVFDYEFAKNLVD
ncbi:anaerobic sulfite reductase subunit AsrB [Fusobacterium vincentii]|uniref:anaerobic sulfite reductase subunit AsrB n=1 Tax=Fusobacterium vincentii TaxID=155615 RepID=UPI000C1C71C4|nr:anaerobic sulfite reductase subunit AsrB [Fusobacterium vincentii]ATV05662.1 anaerobic sulfite reductase subunit AsrB [Fusobacterium vincentii]BET15141.1 anaerobic sulfite reductase subunit AsrB [Fusobacterium vincentii]